MCDVTWAYQLFKALPRDYPCHPNRSYLFLLSKCSTVLPRLLRLCVRPICPSCTHICAVTPVKLREPVCQAVRAANQKQHTLKTLEWAHVLRVSDNTMGQVCKFCEQNCHVPFLIVPSTVHQRGTVHLILSTDTTNTIQIPPFCHALT